MRAMAWSHIIATHARKKRHLFLWNTSSLTSRSLYELSASQNCFAICSL